MIDEKYAKDQIRRLQALKFFPTDTIAAKELISALRCAPSEKIARDTIDEFTSMSQECPVPADIRRAVYAKADTESYALPDWEPPGPICPACNTTGMIQENGLWVRCMCVDGRELQENLLALANSKPVLGKTKSDNESRRYVDRVLIR